MKRTHELTECEPHENPDGTTIASVQRSIPNDNIVYLMSEIFGALGDPTRLRLLLALSRQPLCVHELAQVLNISESAVSHQLRTLKMLRLVTSRRAGKRVYYSLDDYHVYHLIEEGLEHARER